jgi:ariadne-1
LLIHYRWNVENLFCALAEKGTAPIFLEAGLPPPDTKSAAPVADDTSRFVKCGTCLEEVSTSAATRMDCGHAFCNECKHLSLSFTLSIFYSFISTFLGIHD